MLDNHNIPSQKPVVANARTELQQRPIQRHQVLGPIKYGVCMTKWYTMGRRKTLESQASNADESGLVAADVVVHVA